MKTVFYFGKKTPVKRVALTCNIYHSACCTVSSLIQSHYISLSDAAGLRAPPGLLQLSAQLTTNNSQTMWQRHLRAWQKRSRVALCVLPLLARVPKHKKKKAEPLSQMLQRYSSCLPSHSGALDVNDLLLLALCRCDTRPINKLPGPPGYLKVLCTCSHTHICTHTTGEQKPRSCVTNEICWQGVLAGQRLRPSTM